MHHIKMGYRLIAPGDLPTVRDLEAGEQRAATDAELENFGYKRINGDYFASVHQLRTDADGNWDVHPGEERHGTLIVEGGFVDRHKRLPAEHRQHILHAHVFRSDEEDLNTHIAEVMARAKIAPENQREATLAHLRHRAARKDDPVEKHFIPMSQVLPEDVVESEEHPPHSWAGESLR